MTFRKKMAGTIAAVTLTLSATGCDGERPWRRWPAATDAPPDSAVVTAYGSEPDESPEDRETRGMVRKFFPNDRLPGGLSKEAQVIEDRLGVSGDGE